jgi:hypothetical protein
MKKVFYFITSGISVTALVLAIYAFKKSSSATETVSKEKVLHLVKECVEYNQDIQKKEEIYRLLHVLEKKGFAEEMGSDDLRHKYVATQGAVEHVLACMQALSETKLMGMIHTPQPATPLCTKVDPLDVTLLDPSIRHDPEKLLTVKSRASIVREYLLSGGKLYVVYPIGGLEKRSAEQQEIYKAELATYSDRLFESVLSTKTIDPDMVGATYFFRDNQNKIYAFSIKSKQANQISEQSEWGMWLGEIENKEIAKRIDLLFTYLEAYNGPNRALFL